MQSAETSGVTAGGNALPDSTLAAQAAAPIGARAAPHISPMTLAVALTALTAAGLFIAYDIMRSMEEARLITALSPQPLPFDLWSGIEQRGVLAIMLALAAAAFVFRRHRRLARTQIDPLAAIDDLIGALPLGVALWKTDGTLLTCNPNYLKQLHREGPDVRPGRPYREAVRRLTRNGYMRIVGESDNKRVLELHRDDGACLLIDERPLPAGGFVTLVTDITERKRSDLLLSAVQNEQRVLARRYHEEKLKAEAASRAKTSFLAHLSHDVRTPLNHIIGFADLIRHQTYGPLGDTRYLGYVETIKSSGEKLLASFAAILELAELEGGQRPLRQEALNADSLLDAVRQRFAAQASRAGVKLQLGAPSAAQLRGDRLCLERMLGNLVENAIRFTPSGGRIVLAAHAAADGIVMEVTDSGIGMTEEQMARLSQPFAFGDAAFTRKHDGAGLGIAIARAVAELSGGHLVIDSSPALGTTIAISLPQADARGQHAHAA